MSRRWVGLGCVVAFLAAMVVPQCGFGQGEAAKSEAKDTAKTEAKTEAKPGAPMMNTYKCDKTGKTWTQPATEKKACPNCGAAAPDCGTLIKSEPAAKTVWTCKFHKFVSEEKTGRCSVCNMPLVEVPASTVVKKTGKRAKTGVGDPSKEAEECEKEQTE